MIGDSRSSHRKAYLRLVGKGLSSIGGLGGIANSSKGSSSKGLASSMKNLASSYNPGLAKKSKDVALNSSNGSSCGQV